MTPDEHRDTVAGVLMRYWHVESSDETAYDEACGVVDSLYAAGYVVLKDSPDHFVTFDSDGWFIEHSIACRVAGTLGTCEFNQAIREVATEPDPEQFGRWRITEIDSEGLPSLERKSEASAISREGE